MFDPSWRSKHPGYKAAGLGFAIARGIVAAHGGRIWADSAPGSGTTVAFSLTPEG
jgi:signal transduction histidine kinase